MRAHREETDTIQKGIQNTQVDGTKLSPVHSLLCLQCPVTSLPGTGYLYLICTGLSLPQTEWSVLHLRSCQVFVRDSMIAFTPLRPNLFFIDILSPPQGQLCPVFLSLPSIWPKSWHVGVKQTWRSWTPCAPAMQLEQFIQMWGPTNCTGALGPRSSLALGVWPWASHSVSFSKQGGWTKWSLRPLRL